MTKQLKKLHMRKVARAKDRVKLSEPDVRTPEEHEAARQASRAGWSEPGKGTTKTGAPAFLNGRASSTGSAAKTDA
jgi:hypothetical protein